jgi:hypothetical protein
VDRNRSDKFVRSSPFTFFVTLYNEGESRGEVSTVGDLPVEIFQSILFGEAIGPAFREFLCGTNGVVSDKMAIVVEMLVKFNLKLGRTEGEASDGVSLFFSFEVGLWGFLESHESFDKIGLVDHRQLLLIVNRTDVGLLLNCMEDHIQSIFSSTRTPSLIRMKHTWDDSPSGVVLGCLQESADSTLLFTVVAARVLVGIVHKPSSGSIISRSLTPVATDTVRKTYFRRLWHLSGIHGFNQAFEAFDGDIIGFIRVAGCLNTQRSCQVPDSTHILRVLGD